MLFEPAEEEQFFSEIRERLAFIVQKRIRTEEHEDVVQNAMIEVRSRLNEVANKADLIPFVFQILRNCIRDHYQKKKREEKVLEFSPDSRYYYQPEISNDGWQEIVEKGIHQLERENSRCAELLTAILIASKETDLEGKMGMDLLNIYRMLHRCRAGLMKEITETQKIPLP